MGKLKAYASTSVALFKTQDDLEKLLSAHGIRASRWTHFGESKEVPGQVRFEFEWQKDSSKPSLGFRIEVGYQYRAGPRGGNAGTTREQAGRALYWHIKNLFDAIDYGIVDLEQAFMPYMLPAGQESTLYEQLAPTLEALNNGDMPRLLTEGR